MIKPKKKVEITEQTQIIDPADTGRMESFLSIIKDRFNVGSDFSVSGFNDKGRKAVITVQNRDFIIAVTARNTEELAMPLY